MHRFDLHFSLHPLPLRYLAAKQAEVTKRRRNQHFSHWTHLEKNAWMTVTKGKVPLFIEH